MNPLQVAGAGGGLKLMEIRRLAAKGHIVKVIGEQQFWKLVDPTPRGRKAKAAGSRAPAPKKRMARSR